MGFRFLGYIMCGFISLEAFSLKMSPLFFRKSVHLPPEKMCHYHASQMEKLHRIPDKLLRAVSLIESGRSTVKGLIAWPWTINVKGRGHFFSTKQEAVAEVKRLQKKGVKSIDVGCMQINLHHHPEAFESLEQAFDPAHNVAYGAAFLKKLQRHHNDWSLAVGHYHSATPEVHQPYQDKVLKKWLEEKKKTSTLIVQQGIKPVDETPRRRFLQKHATRQHRRMLAAQPSWVKKGGHVMKNVSSGAGSLDKPLYWTNGKRLIRRSSGGEVNTHRSSSHVWSRFHKKIGNVRKKKF